MFGKRWTVLAALFLVGLLLLPLTAVLRAEPQEMAAKKIVVDTGTDPDNSGAKTCDKYTPCSLRRAIVEASSLPEGDRPVTIEFDIPADVNEGYNSALGVWELDILATSDTSVFEWLDFGQITIDGTTQPGGRSTGPKIILVGPGGGSKDGLKIGQNPAGKHDKNVIRGLGFQNFRYHLTINSKGNLIEDNWFGLTSNGEEAYLRDDEPTHGSGSGGIGQAAGVSGNIVRNNAFIGFHGAAVAIRGENNEFRGNTIGTNAAGLVPDKQTDPDLICTKVDWLGGGGITIDGDEHIIEDNIFAGIRQQISSLSNQPDAISVTGDDHVIATNRIGVDKDGVDVGVCGRGIYMIDSPERVLVQSNEIANTGYSGISLNGKFADGNTFRSNVIRNRFQWPQIEGNPAREDAIQLGPSLPESFRLFNPAKVTGIDGKDVQGTNGLGSPCPGCVVELFLDDDDGIVEALQSLAVVTADADGNWTAQLPFELEPDQGLRTTSTTAKYNTIPNKVAGTTTGLSGLYQELKSIPCQGPAAAQYGVCLPTVIGK